MNEHIIFAVCDGYPAQVYSVPEALILRIGEGSVLTVEAWNASRREQLATAVTKVISGNGAKEVLQSLGEKQPPQVLSYLSADMESYVMEQVKDKIAVYLEGLKNNDLPF